VKRWPTGAKDGHCSCVKNPDEVTLTNLLTAETIQFERERADALAFPMFLLSLLFLLLLAGIVITWVDIPRVAEMASMDDVELNTEAHATSLTDALALAESSRSIGKLLFIMLLCIWPLFWIEYIYNRSNIRDEDGARRIRWQRLFSCLVPPLRIGAVFLQWDDRLWLPSLTWQHPGRELSQLLERLLSKPMLVIALLILPILLIEFVFKGLVQEYFWLRMTLHFATGFIWFAFTLEFIVMVSATDRKFAYVKKNWIDLAIILIPLISFLRTLRVLRLARLAKMQKIAKLSRVYRVRSLGTKAMRALMLFGFINKVLKITPEKRLQKMRSELNLRELEIEELKKRIALTEADRGQ